MGTSQSKRDAPSSAPLIPPWADQDPAPPPGPGSEDPATPSPGDDGQQAPTIPALVPLAPPRRYAAFRASLGRYAATGDRRDARAALGHWSRTSTGGAAGSGRTARAARAGGAALAGLARAGAGLPPVPGALDVRTLAGLPTDAAVARIVDAFCPPGILNEELARLSVGEAVAAALAGADTFDPASIDGNAVRVATLALAAELVFVAVAGDGGRALALAPSPVAAVQREADLRSLVREVADVVGTPVLAGIGGVLSPEGMSSLVSRLVEAVRAELATW